MEPKVPTRLGGGEQALRAEAPGPGPGVWSGADKHGLLGQGRGGGPGGAARGAEGLRRRQQGRGYSHEFLTLWSW